MTKLLEKAFREAAKRSPEEQNGIAAVLLAELESEDLWSRAFRGSQVELAALGRATEKEDERGDTEILDPSKL